MQLEAAWDFKERQVQKSNTYPLQLYLIDICVVICFIIKAKHVPSIYRHIFRKESYYTAGNINRSVMLQTNALSFDCKEKAKYHVWYLNVLPRVPDNISMKGVHKKFQRVTFLLLPPNH